MDTREHTDSERDPGVTPGEESWNYRALFAQGTFFSAARSLASPQLVLPFLYLALGAPTFLAGLISPLVQFAQLVSQIVAAPWINASQTRKWYMVICSAMLACVLGIVALSANKQTPQIIIVTVFMFVAFMIGLLQGVNSLAYSDLIGRALRRETRDRLLFLVAAIAGLLAIAVAWATPWIAGNVQPLREHVTLLWLGVTITAIAAFPSAFLRESPSAKAQHVTGLKGFISDMRTGYARTAGVEWFQRYLLARMLLVSVTLAMPFYAVHGAHLHAGKSGSLSAFVMAAGIGAIIGGPLWVRVARRSHRAVLCLGAVTTALAGTWAVVVHTVPSFQAVSLHAIVFVLVSLGNQGVTGSQKLYLVNRADPADRPYYIAVANGLSGILGVVVAFLFGAIAHTQSTVWPVAIVASLNLAAVWASRRL